MMATQQPMPAWVEDAWMRRALERELTAEEQDWFDVYMLDKPRLLQQLEADLDLRDGLAASVAPASDGSAITAPVVSAARRHRRRPHLAWLGRAASVVVSVALGWWAATSYHAQPVTGADTDVLVDPLRIVFDTQRGGDEPVLLFNRGSSSPYLLVEVGVPLDATDVRLIRSAAPDLPLRVSSEGFVSFLWPRDRLPQSPPLLAFRSAGSDVTRELDFLRALKGEN